jgi:hypothetical protein
VSDVGDPPSPSNSVGVASESSGKSQQIPNFLTVLAGIELLQVKHPSDDDGCQPAGHGTPIGV